MPDLDRELASLTTKVDVIERDLAEMKSDIREVRDIVVRAGGGWRALLYVAGAAAFLSGLIVSILAWLWPRG
jgi:chromosome condensin MukBEF ATPase and DNA-binding subunit MukB